MEGQDYEIDYSLGRLRIINPTYLAQGTPIDVSFEDNSLFSLQQKNMLGLRAEYQFSKKSSLGATYLRLYERPFTQKVNIGDDPINNRIFGLDYNYNDEAPWVTKLIDKLPFYSTKEKSNINLTAEVAGIIPGHSKAINIIIVLIKIIIQTVSYTHLDVYKRQLLYHPQQLHKRRISLDLK